MSSDRQEYQKKKQFFRDLLTIYGRKPVLEALEDPKVNVFRLHLAESNKRDGIIRQISELAEQRGVEIAWHERKALSRISRNGKQDQGVAADLQLPGYRASSEISDAALQESMKCYIALDGVNNPQNLGMIIRSVAASGIDGLILPRKGTASLSPLVIKASAGTAFQCPLFHCETLEPELDRWRQAGAEVCCLSSHAEVSLYSAPQQASRIYVLGNETEGVSAAVEKQCNMKMKIPMSNGVESLNVAVTAALLAFANRA